MLYRLLTAFALLALTAPLHATTPPTSTGDLAEQAEYVDTLDELDWGPFPDGILLDPKMTTLQSQICIIQDLDHPDAASLHHDIVTNPGRYPPPVLMFLARALFMSGDKDEATFWFYAAQLRARYDAERTPDISARQGSSILSMQYGGPINYHAFTNLDKLSKTVDRVIAWDIATPHLYDPRWLWPHGLGGPLDASTPGPDQWEDLQVRTRNTYLEQYQQALEMFKAEHAEAMAARVGPAPQFEEYEIPGCRPEHRDSWGESSPELELPGETDDGEGSEAIYNRIGG